MAAAVSQADAQPGPDRWSRASAGWSRASATRWACPGALRRGCSPTTRPTTRAASRPASSTACCYGCGDAVIGINPATDNVDSADARCSSMLDELRQRYAIPTQSCVLAHVTTTLAGASSAARRSTWCSSRSPAPRRPTRLRHRPGAAATKPTTAALSLKPGHASATNVMYFETGQGSALSADAHHGVDQQTLRGPGLRRRPRASSRCW